jgi:hypothetical protein
VSLTTEQARLILDDVAFQDWTFLFASCGTDAGWWLQVQFAAFDPTAGDVAWQKGRKWYVSCHATPSELVQTAFKAVMTAMEHEVRESFYYRNAAIFGPHFDVDELAQRMPQLQLRAPLEKDTAS